MSQQYIRKTLKVVSKMEKRLAFIEDMLRDISMKLCHVIKRKNHYSISEGPIHQ